MSRMTVWLFAASCLGYAGVTIWAAFALPPGPVPTRWTGFDSAPATDYSSRAAAIAVLAALGTAVAVMFTVILLVFARSNTLAGLNIPHKEYWIRPENLPTARRRAITDLALFAALMMLLLAGMGVSIVQAAHDPQSRLPAWMMILFGAWLVFALVWTVWTVTTRWRIPPSDAERGPV